MHVSQEKSDIKVTESKTRIEKKVNKETVNRTVKETKNQKPENSLETYRTKESEKEL